MAPIPCQPAGRLSPRNSRIRTRNTSASGEWRWVHAVSSRGRRRPPRRVEILEPGGRFSTKLATPSAKSGLPANSCINASVLHHRLEKPRDRSPYTWRRIAAIERGEQWTARSQRVRTEPRRARCVGLAHPRDQARAPSPRRRRRPGRQEQVERSLRADEPGQQPGAPVLRGQPPAGVRRREPGAAGREAHVAVERLHQPDTGAGTVDGGDHRLADAAAGRSAAGGWRSRACAAGGGGDETLGVEARAEGASRSGHHDDPNDGSASASSRSPK